MTVTKKMGLVLSAIIAGLIISIGLLFYTHLISQRMDDLHLSARQVISSMYRLNDISKEMQVATYSFETHLEPWQEAYDAFQEDITVLVEHPMLDAMPQETQELVNSASRVWGLLQTSFEEIELTARDVLAQAEEVGLRAQGSLRMQMQLTILMERQRDNRSRYTIIQFDLSKFNNTIQTATTSGTDLIAGNLSEVAQAIAFQSARQTRINLIFSVGIAVLVVLISIVSMLLLGRNISSRVKVVERVMQLVANRDLRETVHVAGTDEFGLLSRHVNEIIGSLSEFLSTVRGAILNVNELNEVVSSGSEESASALNEISENISSIRGQFEILGAHVSNSTAAVNEIVIQVDGLNENIGEQSAAVTQSSASIEEMTASIQSVNELSLDRRNRAEQLQALVRDGGEKIETSNDAIARISKEIVNVQEVISVINDISSQTNILSMNAAIESAHAGEAGKGFAVVAEEIRKLAESTSENSTQIATALESITETIAVALQASHEGRNAIEGIIGDVTSFAAAMVEISHSMEELAAGSSQILHATGSVTEITEKIRNSAQEMKDRSQSVLVSMNSTSDISAEVVNGITEIDSGAREILQSVLEISKQSGQSKERVADLSNVVDTFTLEFK
ncbi:MAG: methyl-accepting chemotaxis protein [Spirochaeta sp.]